MEAKKESKKTEYGCVMLYATVPDWDNKIKVVKEEDIFDDEIKDYGYEHQPHVTLLFGLHLNETKPEAIKAFMETFKPMTATIDTISIFENEKFDVVKFDVPVTDEIKKYHDALLANYPNTQTFPDYHPHMTIAYVLPGKGKQYKGKVKPFKVTFDLAVYSFSSSGSEKDKIKVKLK